MISSLTTTTHSFFFSCIPRRISAELPCRYSQLVLLPRAGASDAFIRVDRQLVPAVVLSSREGCHFLGASQYGEPHLAHRFGCSGLRGIQLPPQRVQRNTGRIIFFAMQHNVTS